MNIVLHSEIQQCFAQIREISHYVEMNYGPVISQIDPKSVDYANYNCLRKKLDDYLIKVVNSRSSRRTYIYYWNTLLGRWAYVARELGTINNLHIKMLSEEMCNLYEKSVEDMVCRFRMSK